MFLVAASITLWKKRFFLWLTYSTILKGVVMDGGQDPWHSMGLNWRIGECIDGPGGEGREGGMKV